MNKTKAPIAALRRALSKAELKDPEKPALVPLGHDCADACLGGGLRLGAVHEIFSEGGHEAVATGFAAVLSFRVTTNKHVLWIGQDFSAAEFGALSATGLVELGLDPARLLLLRGSNVTDILRAGHDALSCAALGAVVLEIPGASKILNLAASQRLMLASARKGVTVFVLRFLAEPQASAAETRWHIRAARSFRQEDDWGRPVFEAALARNRHGRTGRWTLQWSCDDGRFQEPCGTAHRKTHSGVMVSASSDRSIAAAKTGTGAGRGLQPIS